jgi:hypothetical protein
MPFFVGPFDCRPAILRSLAHGDKRFHFIAL